MRRAKSRLRGFALYEVMIGVTIFAVGILTLGRSVANCMNASSLNAEEDRVRLILSNRMAEIQATPGVPDANKEAKIDTGFGSVQLLQKTAPAALKDEKDLEVSGINLVTLTAQWSRNGVAQTKTIEFYVYRAG